MAAISRSRNSGSGHTEVDTQKISPIINGEEDHGEDDPGAVSASYPKEGIRRSYEGEGGRADNREGVARERTLRGPVLQQ